MPSPELRTVGKRDKCGWNKIKTQARTSPKKEEKKKNNTINAVIHENDLQNGTQKEIKLWAWFGNPWILPGSDDGSTEADPLISEKEDNEYGGVAAWRITTGSDDTGCFTFLPHAAKRSGNYLQLLLSRMWPLTFLKCSASALEPVQPLHWPVTSAQNQVELLTWRDLTNKALVR